MERERYDTSDGERPAPISADERLGALKNLDNFQGPFDREKYGNLLLMALRHGVVNKAASEEFMDMSDEMKIQAMGLQLKTELRRVLSGPKLDS
jgi:hypothetical protein